MELVRLLDGLPLALELAAGQLQVLGLPVIVRRLEQRVASLRWEFRDLPERQQSLQAAIGWSYDLLPTEEQRLFRHLGVFVGRVSAAGMAAVLGEDEEDALLGLIALTEKSLLLPVPLTEEEAEPAFGMLETVREYAREQLVAQGELETAAAAHAAYFLALAEEAEPRLRGTEQERWLANLETAYDNLRAALGWAREHGERRAGAAAGERTRAFLGGGRPPDRGSNLVGDDAGGGCGAGSNPRSRRWTRPAGWHSTRRTTAEPRRCSRRRWRCGASWGIEAGSPPRSTVWERSPIVTGTSARPWRCWRRRWRCGVSWGIRTGSPCHSPT